MESSQRLRQGVVQDATPLFEPRKREVIRNLVPWDVWAAIVTAIVAVVFAVVVDRASLSFFLIVALALCIYAAKVLSERRS
jgi:hypothetical protein